MREPPSSGTDISAPAAVLCLTALTLLSGIATLVAGTFVSDDFFLISAMVDQRGEPATSAAFRQFLQPLPGVAPPLPSDFDPKFWRPLWRFSFFLDYSLWGLKPTGYLATNLAFHLVGVIATWFLARLIGMSSIAALGAASVMAVHPLQHEAVWWIAGRGGVMATTFSLVACVAIAQGVQARSLRASVFWSLLAALTLLLGLLSKESALVAPAVLCLAGIVALRPGGSGSLGRAGAIGFPSVVVFASYLVARRTMLGEFVGGYGGLKIAPFSPEAWENQFQSLETLFGLVRGDLAGTNVGPGIALGLLAAVSVSSIRMGLRRDAHTGLQLGFALVWLALALLPTWQFGVPSTSHESARFLYPLIPAASLLTAGVLAELFRGHARGLNTSLILFVAVSFGLLQWNGSPRREAWRVARQLFPAVWEIGPPPRGSHYVFVDLPDQVAGAYLGRNALPNALMPPFVAAPPEGGVHALTDAPWEQARLQGMAPMAREPQNKFFLWDANARQFKPMRPR